jgi:hypothetical protein
MASLERYFRLARQPGGTRWLESRTGNHFRLAFAPEYLVLDAQGSGFYQCRDCALHEIS